MNWFELAVLTAVGGIGIALAAWLIDTRPRLQRARGVLATAPLDRASVALLSGGAGRAVDAEIVHLAELGDVQAAGGALALTDAGRERLGRPVGPGGFDALAACVLVAVRDGGAESLDALRRRTDAWAHGYSLRRLVERGMIVTPLRRQWSAMVLVGPVLIALFGAAMGLIMNDFMGSNELAAVIVMLSWLPVALLVGVLWNRRPGYHGHNPQSRLGRDVLTELRARVAADPAATDADRVALDGFTAMRDGPLRREVQGATRDASWRVPLRRRRYHHSDALLAAALGMSIGHGFDGGGGDADAAAGDAGGGE